MKEVQRKKFRQILNIFDVRFLPLLNVFFCVKFRIFKSFFFLFYDFVFNSFPLNVLLRDLHSHAS